MKTFLRFNMMRERDTILEHKEDIDGLVIDAHIVETFSNASSSYLISNQFPYIVDPITYRFSIDIVEEYISKKWFSKLIDLYNIENLLLDNGRIDMSELINNNNLQKFTENVIKYQENRLIDLSGNTLSFINWIEGEETTSQKPLCIIPPYFIIQDSAELEINIKSLEYASDLTELPIYAIVPIYYDLLYDPDFLMKILNDYANSCADGFFFWVTDFNEVKEKGAVLRIFKEYLSEFKTKIGSRELINMYGGYFSTILSAINILDGVVHGVGLSEYKNPFNVGGPAPTRYYVPILHRMLSPESAMDLLEGQSFRCNCPICLETSISDMDVSKLIIHVLNAKIYEREEIKSYTEDQIIRKLECDYDKVINAFPKKQRIKLIADHLLEWKKALES